MASAASSFLISASPLLITAPPSSQHNNSTHQGIASFGCTPRRSSGLDSGKLVLGCSRKGKRDVRVFVSSPDFNSPYMKRMMEKYDAEEKEKLEIFQREMAEKLNADIAAADKSRRDEMEKLSARAAAALAESREYRTTDKGFVDMKKEINFSKISTKLMNVKSNLNDPHHASSIPIYQTATYKVEKLSDFDEEDIYKYTRFGNPTRDVLESLAQLETTNKKLKPEAFCFTSGMAALTAVLHLLKEGDEIVAGHDIYGGSDELLKQWEARTRKQEEKEVKEVKEKKEEKQTVLRRANMSDLDDVAKYINKKTKLVWFESPTNPRIRICDIEKIAAIAHDKDKGHNALVLIDNSIMSPVLSRPLDHGADIVMHSATKFMGGHSDVMGGVLVVKDESLAKELKKIQKNEGSGLSPFDCWVCLRGLKTMALRVEKQQDNAQQIANFLYKCESDKDFPVKKVNYVGLPSDPGHKLHYKQADGAGSVLSFTTGSVVISQDIIKFVKLFALTVSFGNVKSLISLPSSMSNKGITIEDREARGLEDDLIRISVGIEDAEELISDLSQALKKSIGTK